MNMNVNGKSVIIFLYTKLYVVIYGVALLIFSQFIPIHPNMYVLIFSQNIISYLVSSGSEVISMIGKYIVIVILMLPLISIEIARTLSHHKLNILFIEILIFLLITGNIIFIIVYTILTIILIKFLKPLFYIENEHKKKISRENENQLCKTVEMISNSKIGRTQKYAMMFISIGTSILVYVILTTILRITIFLISILIYIIAIMIVYTHNYHYKSATISTLVKQAILVGIPPYGVISYI